MQPMLSSSRCVKREQPHDPSGETQEQRRLRLPSVHSTETGCEINGAKRPELAVGALGRRAALRPPILVKRPTCALRESQPPVLEAGRIAVKVRRAPRSVRGVAQSPAPLSLEASLPCTPGSMPISRCCPCSRFRLSP
jgi:hypothetical protein